MFPAWYFHGNLQVRSQAAAEGTFQLVVAQLGVNAVVQPQLGAMPVPRPFPLAEGKLGRALQQSRRLHKARGQGRAGRGASPMRRWAEGQGVPAAPPPGGGARPSNPHRADPRQPPSTSISTSSGDPCLPQPSPWGLGTPLCPLPSLRGSRAADPAAAGSPSAIPPPPRQAAGTYPRSLQPSTAAVVAGRARKRGLK